MDGGLCKYIRGSPSGPHLTESGKVSPTFKTIPLCLRSSAVVLIEHEIKHSVSYISTRKNSHSIGRVKNTEANILVHVHAADPVGPCAQVEDVVATRITSHFVDSHCSLTTVPIEKRAW